MNTRNFQRRGPGLCSSKLTPELWPVLTGPYTGFGLNIDFLVTSQIPTITMIMMMVVMKTIMTTIMVVILTTPPTTQKQHNVNYNKKNPQNYNSVNSNDTGKSLHTVEDFRFSTLLHFVVSPRGSGVTSPTVTRHILPFSIQTLTFWRQFSMYFLFEELRCSIVVSSRRSLWFFTLSVALILFSRVYHMPEISAHCVCFNRTSGNPRSSYTTCCFLIL